MTAKHRIGKIIIPADLEPRPEIHEISAGVIISKFFEADVTFIKPHQHAKSADFNINGTIWELKSPRGAGKRTIQNNLRSADNQSVHIILDLRRIKMHSIQAHNRIEYELGKANKIKRLLVITKNSKVLVLK